MRGLRSRRVHATEKSLTAPSLHAVLLAITCVLMSMSSKPILGGHATAPLTVLFLADLTLPSRPS